MATGRFGSPAKNMNKGYGPAKTSSPAKQRSGGISGDVLSKGISALESSKKRTKFKDISEEMEPARGRGMKKELKKIKKKVAPSALEAEGIKVKDPKEGIVNTLPKNNENNKTKKDKKQLTAKQKALKALKDAQKDNEVSNIEKQTSKVIKNSTKKRKQAKRKDSQAERRTEKTKRLEERIERRKARRSPAKQANVSAMTQPKKKTSKSKVGIKDNEPSRSKKSLKSGGGFIPGDKMTAKQKEKSGGVGSPAKQRTGGNRITKKTLVKKLPELGNKNAEMGSDGKMTIITANMAKNYKPIPLRKMKGKKMKMEKVAVKAKQDKSPAKQSKSMTPAEVSKFEKNIEIQEKFDAKIKKAKGNTKKIERLTKRANRKMDRSAN